ncbi:hypothetical protein [Methylosinus trichosporium]|uniref:hypothetical protein n=1 Tax=Methylosinus trichosporium TaxID=426 RepID=UPI0013000A0A|nr:hypothetical protein [Methylosinus trichosporium]
MQSNNKYSAGEEKNIASMFAGITAVISELCELLIEKKAIDRNELKHRLYRLHEKAVSHGGAPAAAAVSHLIHILEAADTEGKTEQPK